MRLPALTVLRALACTLLLIATPGAQAAFSPATSVATAPAAPPRAAEDQPAEKSCKQGKRTKAFGWTLVDYGLSTAKYLVGLFLIPIGLLLVVVGAVVQVVEAVACT